MYELNQPTNDHHEVLDDALRTYPVQSAPESLMPAVMARLSERAPAPIPARYPAALFRPTWLDYALSLFAAGMVTLALALSPAVPVPPDWRARLHMALLYLWHRLRFDPDLQRALLGAATAFSAVLVLAAMAALWRARSRFA